MPQVLHPGAGNYYACFVFFVCLLFFFLIFACLLVFLFVYLFVCSFACVVSTWVESLKLTYFRRI